MLNKITIQARHTADPELKTVGGFSLCEFTVAWSEKYKDREDKCFLRCKAWRNQAEHIVKHYEKGKECIIEGKLITEQWTGDDGKAQSRTICNVEKIHFVSGSRSTPAGSGDPKPGDEEFMKMDVNTDEELPFK